MTSTAYTTYCAVLSYLHSGHIDFTVMALLRRAPYRATSLEAQRKSLAVTNATVPNLPLPASAKSVYKLAHLLDMPQLQKLALANYKSQLSSYSVG